MNDATGISVGENREHLSLLSSSRRYREHYHSVRVSSLAAVPEPTSSQNADNNDIDRDASSSLSVSIPTKYRMMSYYRLILNRRPRGMAVFLVLLILFFETFAFFGALSGVRQLLPVSSGDSKNGSSHDLESFLLSLLYSTAGRVFYPVAGVIADSYLGRYAVIHIGLWLLWVGFSMNSLSFSLAYLMTPRSAARYVLAVLSIILFSAGSGSVEAVLIPFGVDQLYQGASSDELSSYFYYYFMARNAGALCAVLTFIVVFDGIKFEPASASVLNAGIQYATQSLLAVVAISIALVVLFCMKNKFYHDRQHTNALKLIYRVLSYAATVKRHIPRINRSFRYGEERKARIELAKIEYDGIFSSEEVEDVKTFCRMLFFLLSLFGYFATYGAVSNCQ